MVDFLVDAKPDAPKQWPKFNIEVRKNRRGSTSALLNYFHIFAPLKHQPQKKWSVFYLFQTNPAHLKAQYINTQIDNR